MSVHRVDIHNFMELTARMPLLDVRSPGEFAHAHIPGAQNLPLFTDEERKLIGTAYKQESRETAIRIGLNAFGKEMVAHVDKAEAIVKKSGGGKEVAMHCWRGGMRSGAMAWLLDLYGFRVHTLAGGYKAYRRYVLEMYTKPFELNVLGGCTGANKTGVILEMRRRKMKAIDLEGLAGHMGSAFGNLDQVPQPTQEQFENNLAAELATHSATPGPVWVEAESQRIGTVNIPGPFFSQMRAGRLVFLDVPFETRLDHIIKGYGRFDREKLVNAILRIRKKLGGLEMKTAVNCLLDDDLAGCFAILLRYYDKLYMKTVEAGRESQRPHVTVAASSTSATENLDRIIEACVKEKTLS